MKRIETWLQGLGLFLLIAILTNSFLIKKTIGIIENEKYELFSFLFITISVVFMPLILTKVTSQVFLALSKIINYDKKSTDRDKLQFFLSWSFKIIVAAIAILTILFKQSERSFSIYTEPQFIQYIRSFSRLSLSYKLFFFICVSILITFLFFYLRELLATKTILKPVFFDIAVVVFVCSIVAKVAWDTIYLDKSFFSLYHFNVVLLPLVAFNDPSSQTPLVSEGFTTIYGGYYLWLAYLVKWFGNSLFGVRITVTGLVILQIIFYRLIVEAFFKTSFLKNIVFVTGVFWAYLYQKVVLNDIYFQYFPLRTIFPSIFLIVCIYTIQNKFLNKNIFSNQYFNISILDILLDWIVAFAILNNIDSGISVLVIHFFFYHWNVLNQKIIDWKQIVQRFLSYSVHALIIVVLLIVSFKILSGKFIDFSLFIAMYRVAGKSSPSLPYPDNMWMLSIVFYGYNLVRSFRRSSEEPLDKYRFAVSIWGITGFVYFVNRSHPWNLLNISLPFFIAYGIFIESIYAERFQKNKTFSRMSLRVFAKNLLPNWRTFLPFTLFSIYAAPFISLATIAYLQFIPLSISNFSTPKNYQKIADIEALSNQVARLEAKLNRPSIILSESFESYYYFLKKRPVLYYPDMVSIQFMDSSFQPRFSSTLQTYNPIVVSCSFQPEFQKIFQRILADNNYQALPLEKEIKIGDRDSCQILIRDGKIP